jgi:tetratricopeptide (TPR) repeat protein
MSHINDALRKAQKEKDNRYSKYAGIISSGSVPGTHAKKERRAFPLMTLVVLFAVVFLLTMHTSSRVVVHSQNNDRPASTQQIITVAQREPYETPPVANKQESTGRIVPARQVRPSSAATAAPVASKESSAEAATLYKEALKQQLNKNLTAAEQLYAKVLTADARHVQAMNNLGVIYMSQKKDDKALRMFERAIALKSDYVDPYYNMACLYARYKDIKSSVQYLRTAMSIDSAVKKWAEKDDDLRSVRSSPEFRKLMENGGLQKSGKISGGGPKN